MINADHPKHSLKEDKLGYAPFAKVIAKAISLTPSKDGLVLAIHGPWGSGKTSAVNMVVEELETLGEADQSKKVIVVRFNPWWFSGQQDLTTAFFSELSIALNGEKLTAIVDGLKKVARRILNEREALFSLLDFIPGGSIAKNAMNGILDGAAQKLEEEKSLDDERSELCKTLEGEPRRILVIIDDIDRLPADEAQKIFRLVKSVADFPNVTYLLVFDRRIVANALRGDISADGLHWLEKIIQASFDLPPIQKLDLEDFFLAALKEAVGEVKGELDDDTLQRWHDLYPYVVEPWVKTPRDVVRLCNALLVSYPPVADEVNFVDFVALETLRLFESEVYNLIRHSRLTATTDDKIHAEIANNLLDVASENRKKEIGVLLSCIFPCLKNHHQLLNINHTKLNDLFMGIDPNRGTNSWGNQKRCYIDRNFQTYFTFTAGGDVITRPEWEQILSAFQKPDTAQELIQDYRQRKDRSGKERGELLLDQIRRYAEEIPSEQRYPTVQTFLQVADAFLGSDTPPRYDHLVPSATNALIFTLPIEDRARAISCALDSASSLKLLTDVIFELAREHGHFTEYGPYPEHQRRLPKEAMDRLEECIREKLTEAAKSGALLTQPKEMTFWFLFVGAAKAKAYTDGWLERDESCSHLANVARYALSKNERHLLTSCLDVNRLVERLTTIKPNADSQQTDIIDRFMQKWEKG